jgi:hypothetical protein
MRRNPRIGAGWLTVLLQATVGVGSGQVVTKEPNTLGLDIESVTLDTAASSAKIVVHNTSGKPITAYVVNLAPVYSDGEKPSGESLIDFFASVGMRHLFPPGPGSDPNIDSITPGTSRESRFWYEKAQAGAQLSSIRVAITGLILGDESTAGSSKRIAEIVAFRDAKSAEIARWCDDVKQFSGGAVVRKAVNDMFAAHEPAPRLDGRPAPGGAAEAERKELLGILQQGLEWRSDGTATLRTWTLEYFDVSCATARAHLQRMRGAQ